MIKKVIKKRKLSRYSEIKDNLKYWLNRPPEERINAVEQLRAQYYGCSARLQRVARVIKFSQS